MLLGRFLMSWAARGWGSVGIVPEPDGTRTKLMASANSGGGPIRNLPWDVEAVGQIERVLHTHAACHDIHCEKCLAANQQSAKCCARCGAAL
jgi:hypothetical protein